MSRIKFLILAIVLGFALFPLSTRAVTVAPGKIQYKADPGEIISGKLFIINEGVETQTFYASFEKFIEQGGEKKFLPKEESELASWFKMEMSATIEPGEQREIPFTIEVPETAPPGGHFAVIWWGTAPPSGQVAIVTRAGILVYLQVSGQVNEGGELLNFSLSKGKFFVFNLPEDFSVEFKNNGNTYLKPLGNIKIKNIFGSTIAEFAVNDKERILLPQDTQSLNVAKRFEKTPFAFGLYKAELSLRWGSDQNNVSKSIYFFVFAWKIALLAVMIILGIFLLLTKGIKKYNQWIVNKYGKHLNPEPPESKPGSSEFTISPAFPEIPEFKTEIKKTRKIKTNKNTNKNKRASTKKIKSL